MLICADCRVELDAGTNCSMCKWKVDMVENFPIFLSSRDKSDPNFMSYRENYDVICKDDLLESIQDDGYLKQQTAKLFSYLPVQLGENICEIGLGKGYLFDKLLSLKDKNISGVDISIGYLKKYQKLLSERIKIYICNAENLPFIGMFDTIIAADIIEHVFNVGDFLYSVNKALTPKGNFIVRAPYNEDITMYSRLQGCQYNFVHLRNFNKQSIQSVLVGAGFKIKQFYFDGFNPDDKFRRAWLKEIPYFNRRFDEYLDLHYPDRDKFNTVSNFWGNLFLRPLEMTVVCEKVRDL